MGVRRPGDKVNIESDIMAKYVERILSGRGVMAAAPS
jgi:riboflavin synthase alpha subunit